MGGGVAEAEAGGEVEEAVGVEVGRTKMWGWHFMEYGNAGLMKMEMKH